jgi:hypothetical protein
MNNKTTAFAVACIVVLCVLVCVGMWGTAPTNSAHAMHLWGEHLSPSFDRVKASALLFFEDPQNTEKDALFEGTKRFYHRWWYPLNMSDPELGRCAQVQPCLDELFKLSGMCYLFNNIPRRLGDTHDPCLFDFSTPLEKLAFELKRDIITTLGISPSRVYPGHKRPADGWWISSMYKQQVLYVRTIALALSSPETWNKTVRLYWGLNEPQWGAYGAPPQTPK